MGSQRTSRTSGVACTANQPSTSMLSALQLIPAAWPVLEITIRPPPPQCLPLRSSLEGTTGPRMQTPSAHRTPIHTPPPPPATAPPPSSLLCPPCGPLASEQKSLRARLHPCCLLRSAQPLQIALQCPLVLRLNMTALERYTATSTATSPPYIFDCIFVCASVFLKYLCKYIYTYVLHVPFILLFGCSH